MVNQDQLSKESSAFRKDKIAQEPKTEMEEELRGQMITKERGEDIPDFNKVAKEQLREAYYEIIDVLRGYIEMKEDYYPIIACWIIGTYFHKQFKSFPYLFFNAMRGSGKTKTIDLISTLSKDGNMMTSPTEAVLFRMKGTLAIDELERIASKEKASIRELLNACYKSSVKVFRMRKKKVMGEEQQVVEEFSPYRPIVMANIGGMDEVLGDRCITLVLEKSNNPFITRRSSAFDEDEGVKKVKELCMLCMECRLCIYNKVYKKYDDYLKERFGNYIPIYTQPTLTTHTTTTTHKNSVSNDTKDDVGSVEVDLPIEKDKMYSFFNKITDANIKGRNLELFLPIFIIANIVGDIELKEIIKTTKKITDEKIKDEEMESQDVMIYDYVSSLEINQFKPIKEHTSEFLKYLGEDSEYINPTWMGRAFKRLNLITSKRRVYRGVEVILNIKKAKEKMQLFKK